MYNRKPRKFGHFDISLDSCPCAETGRNNHMSNITFLRNSYTVWKLQKFTVPLYFTKNSWNQFKQQKIDFTKYLLVKVNFLCYTIPVSYSDFSVKSSFVQIKHIAKNSSNWMIILLLCLRLYFVIDFTENYQLWIFITFLHKKIVKTCNFQRLCKRN